MRELHACGVTCHLSGVRGRLDPTHGRRPAGVKRWINVTDKGDLIAIPKGGIQARFQEVDDDTETSVHWADFHTVGNYLRTDALADVLRPHLG